LTFFQPISNENSICFSFVYNFLTKINHFRPKKSVGWCATLWLVH
jgi:hypothetical protein